MKRRVSSRSSRGSTDSEDWVDIKHGEVISADDLGRALEMERRFNARLQQELKKKDAELAKERERNERLQAENQRQALRITTLTQQLGLVSRQMSVMTFVSKRTLARQDRHTKTIPKHHAALVGRTSLKNRAAAKNFIRKGGHRTHLNTNGRNHNKRPSIMA